MPALALSKALSEAHSSAAVIAVDARNHGSSFHSADHSAADIARDLNGLLDREGPYVLMGHSMSGVAVMEGLIRRQNDVAEFTSFPRADSKSPIVAAVVVDICPYRSPPSPSAVILGYLNAMMSVPLDTVETLKDADQALSISIPDITMRRFLLMQFVAATKTRPASWKCNLPVLQRSLMRGEIFLSTAPTDKVTAPTHFVFGSRSEYNTEGGRSIIPQFFANATQVEVADAGHFVHADQPTRFCDAVLPFLKQHLP